ncbi:MAG TPA: succinylglutamate desuccinylase [Noviherbaspirillum sp.]
MHSSQTATDNGIPACVRALAAADFTHIAGSFANAGCTVRLPAHGILQLSPQERLSQRARLLLSVGIHGDETAPVEMLAHLLNELAHDPQALALDLMVVVGNPAAISQGKRFIDADLNRMFSDGHGALQAAAEAGRADEIMRATGNFFAGGDAETWHLDLHTAIRPSHYPAFAVVPDIIADTRKSALLAYLGRAGIGAAILNRKSAGTYSAYTASMFGAVSATVELGQVGALGANDLNRFADARAVLDDFIRFGRVPAGGYTPQVFRVVQELVKHSDAFRMTVGRNTWNFTEMQPGSVIAEDGDIVYRVGAVPEYLVFPNPDVRNGLRAGLMVVREE